MPAAMPADAGSLKKVVSAAVVPTHFGPDMLPDLSTRTTMSSGICWAAALVEEQTPASSIGGAPSLPASKSMSIPPAPPPLALLDDAVPPPFPPDELESGPAELDDVKVLMSDAVQPHH